MGQREENAVMRALCMKWDLACKDVDAYYEACQISIANNAFIEMEGWLEGADHMLRRVGMDDLADEFMAVRALWLYRYDLVFMQMIDAEVT